MVDFTNLQLVLAWLSTSGAVVYMSWWSDLFRNLREPTDKTRSPIEQKLSDWAVSLSPMGSQLVAIAGAFIPPALAGVLLTLVPAEVFAAVQPYYGFIAAVLTSYLLARAQFEVTKKSPPVG